MIEAYASTDHYWRHLAPIVAQLRARGHDVETRRRTPGPARLRLVASWVDARRERTTPTVYVEHGAGQTYTGVDRGYAGAGALEHVVLFLAPSARIEERWAMAYPRALARAIGCPVLDRHVVRSDTEYSASDSTRTVVWTMHWECGVVPETKPAVAYFREGIGQLVRAHRELDVRLVGHGHPRSAGRAQALWKSHDVVYEPDPDRVLATAGLLIADNTSLMYEAAALGIPVLALNAPWYRRDVEHGLRFWSHVPGLQCDSVGSFLPSVEAALADPAEAQRARARAAAYAYGPVDGRAGERAADAIEELL